MQQSAPNNPCPVCGRTKDGDCRWNDSVILCHQGSSNGPPQHLRPGDVLSVNGADWALIRRNAGYSGQAALFRPHRAKDHQPAPTPAATAPQHQEARETVATAAIKQFLDHYRRCWNIPDFHSLPHDHLQEAFRLIYQTEAEGLALARTLQQVWREQPAVRDHYRHRFEHAIKSIRYQRSDVDHFRVHYLGECVA